MVTISYIIIIINSIIIIMVVLAKGNGILYQLIQFLTPLLYRYTFMWLDTIFVILIIIFTTRTITMTTTTTTYAILVFDSSFDEFMSTKCYESMIYNRYDMTTTLDRRNGFINILVRRRSHAYFGEIMCCGCVFF